LKYGSSIIPNLAGIKYTASTIHEYQSCLEFDNGKFDVLFGYDELLLPALSIGAKSAIGSTYTFAAPLYLKNNGVVRSGRYGCCKKTTCFYGRSDQDICQIPVGASSEGDYENVGLGPWPLQTAIVNLIKCAIQSVAIGVK